ncbi:MAG: tadG [Phenylobacterium sp.]|jgi:Flp pilus assembly protein TadG|nr:tadG [Phenylobacterium sp.]
MDPTPPRGPCPTAPALRPAAKLLRDRRGAAAVEFALLAPVLLLLLAGLIDVSRLIVTSLQVRAAAQAGADYARARGWDAVAVAGAVTGATPLAAAASPAPLVTKACVSGQSIVATTATTCSGGGTPGDFVTVAAQAPFKALAPWPHIVMPASVSAHATVRLP